jgi:Heterokaryon incompatibility protein (HET)
LTQLRLFSLEPGTDPFVVQGRLITRPLPKREQPSIFSVNEQQDTDETLPYDALSYVWTGDDVDSAKAMERNVPMMMPAFTVLTITVALHKALLALRDSTSPRLLWIDQICINQRHPWERETQVANMHRIYGGAGSVIAWIGPAKPAITEFITLAEQLPGILTREIFATNAAIISAADFISTLLQEKSDAPAGEKVKAYLATFLNITWLWRAWTYQEAAVCENTIVQCGTQIISLTTLALAVRATYRLAMEQPWFHDVEIQTTTTRALSTILKLLELRQRLQNASPALRPFRLLLQDVRNRGATDDRDKVYSVLGLMSFQYPEAWPVGRAKYSRPAREVFMDATVLCAQRDKNLDIFSRCCYTNAEYYKHDVPSWADDWSVPYIGCPREFFSSRMRLRETSLGIFSAATQLDPVIKYYSKDSGIISLRGYLFDTVSEIVPRMPEEIFGANHLIGDGIPEEKFGDVYLPAIPSGSNLYNYITGLMLDPDFLPPGHSGWQKLLASLRELDNRIFQEWLELGLRSEAENDPYGGEIGRQNAFWRTLVEDIDLDTVYESADAVKRLPGIFTDHVRSWILPFQDEIPPGPRKLSDESAAFKQNHWLTWMTRRLFRTQHGYLGISCNEVKPNDKVCLLNGGAMPFLLRETGRINFRQMDPDYTVPCHVFVGGEVYVHGIVDGEGVALSQQWAHGEEEFFIS